MNSSLPKVLQPIAQRPMLQHVLGTAKSLQPSKIVIVYGHGGTQVRAHVLDEDLIWAYQEEQKGTAHAVMQALDYLDPNERVLILYGDVPLLRAETLQRMVALPCSDLVLLTQRLSDPTGYGRILRNISGQVQGIREEKDASVQERNIQEINTGIMLVPANRLAGWLARIDCQNAQGEYYLTDLVQLAVADEVPISTVEPGEPWEALGVNDKSQLAQLEKIYQYHQAEALLKAGVTLMDPERVAVRGQVTCGRDVTLDVGVILEGQVTLGDNVSIGPYCVIRNAHVGQGSIIEAFCHIDGANLGGLAHVGPYARIRPGTVTAEGVHLGNFVEIKNSTIGVYSKANHLTYLGDSTVGERVNVGAGTITCNYDGANKHRTVIGDDVFIGSDTQLIAPVTIESGATIGAGSTIVRRAPAGELTLSRSEQVTKKGWKRPRKGKTE